MIDSPRDRILAAINCETLDRIPTDYWGTGEVTEKVCRHLGCESTLEMYDRLEIDGIMGVTPPYIGPPLPNQGKGGAWIDSLQAWGMRFKPQPYPEGIYWEQWQSHRLLQHRTPSVVVAGWDLTRARVGR